MTRIVVEVRGGIVRAVHCDDPDASVHICDWDDADDMDDEEADEAETRYEAAIDGLKAVY